MKNRISIKPVHCFNIDHNTRVGLRKIILDVQYSSDGPGVIARALIYRGRNFRNKYEHMNYLRTLEITGYHEE